MKRKYFSSLETIEKIIYFNKKFNIMVGLTL